MSNIEKRKYNLKLKYDINFTLMFEKALHNRKIEHATHMLADTQSTSITTTPFDLMFINIIIGIAVSLLFTLLSFPQHQIAEYHNYFLKFYNIQTI